MPIRNAMVTFLLSSRRMQNKVAYLGVAALLAVTLTLSCARSFKRRPPAEAPAGRLEKPRTERAPRAAALGRFPHSLAEEKLIYSAQPAARAETLTATVAILLPPERRSVHLRACAVLAARLGQLDYLSERDCRLGLIDDGPELDRSNGVIVGRRDELVGVPLPTAIIEKLAALRSEQGLLAEFVFGTNSAQQRKWVVVSGADDAGLEKAILTVGHSPALAAAPPSPAVIDAAPVLPLSGQPEPITALHQVQRIFTQDRFLRQTAFLVPSSATLEELQSLFSLAMQLGRRLPSSAALWPEACVYSAVEPPPLDRLKQCSVLLLGSVAQWKGALPPGCSPLLHGIEGETEWVRVAERRYRIADFEPSLTLLQLCASPWSNSTSLLIAGRWHDWASPTLGRIFGDPKLAERLRGPFAAVDARGRIATFGGDETFTAWHQRAFPGGLRAETTSRPLSHQVAPTQPRPEPDASKIDLGIESAALQRWAEAEEVFAALGTSQNKEMLAAVAEARRRLKNESAERAPVKSDHRIDDATRPLEDRATVTVVGASEKKGQWRTTAKIEKLFLILAYIAAFGFLVRGLDALFLDWRFLTFLWRNRKKPILSFQELKLVPEQWIAVFVPAWQESGVVNKMAEYAARVIRYEKYDVFIGVYPNDPETNQCVEELCAVNPRIHKVVVPHPGPTNKADCLNWIYRAMKLHEIPGVREYKTVALYDAASVLHPLALKVYNYFVPREYDMAQLPVFALELPVWKYWSGNTYVDHFAERHTKHLFLQQSLGGIVPSSGVGTAFSRTLLYKLAIDNNGDPFRIDTLTEDYEMGLRARRAGYRCGVVNFPVERTVRRQGENGTLTEPRTITEIVAVRESFPQTFAAAVRQRSRWILSSSFHSWKQSSWACTLTMSYHLLRDRLAPLAYPLNMAGYLVLGYLLLPWLVPFTPWHVNLRPLFLPGSLLWQIALVAVGLLFFRAVQRMVSVKHVYGLKQALFSVPRVVVGNLINFAATAQATKMYLANKLWQQPLVWAKTSHVFPGESVLREYIKTIEDLLIEEGLATHGQIDHALQTANVGSAPQCLMRLGLLDEKQFTGIWSKHSGLKVHFLNPYELPPELLHRFTEKESLEADALPIEQKADQIVMAFAEPPTTERLLQIGQRLGAPLRPVLARPSNIAFARDRVYPALVLPSRNQNLHLQRFQQTAHIASDAFLETLSTQHRSRQSLPDVMISAGLLNEPQARRIWAEMLDCAPADSREFTVNRELYTEIGAAFWWFHRLVPMAWDIIAAAVSPHPLVIRWLAEKMGARVDFVAELPSKVELAVALDPDQLLIQYLTTKGLLKSDQLAKLQVMRSLLIDPLPRWLTLQKLVTEEQLHQAFLEICQLPAADPWRVEEVQRLRPVFPPGFAEENGCHILEAVHGGVRIGVGRMPSTQTLRELHDRLRDYPIFFQALSYHDATTLSTLASRATGAASPLARAA